MKRIIPFLLVLVLCITCLVSPVSAASASTMYDVLDYASVNDTGSNYFSFTSNKQVQFQLPGRSSLRYVDMIVDIVGSVTSVSVGYNSSTNYELDIQQIDGSLYRVSGEIPSRIYNLLFLNFVTDTSDTKYVTIYSLKVSSISVSSFPSLASLNVWDSVGGSTTISMSSPTDEPEVYLTQASGSTVSYAEFITTVYLNEWKKFNYLDVLLYCDVEHINSLFVRQGDLFLDYDVSYLTPADQINTYYWVMVHIDLSSCEFTSSTTPMLVVTGTYYNQVSYNKIRLKSIIGLVDVPEPNVLQSFWYNLRDFLSDLFGENDSSADSAIQTQQDINININNQIVGAVEDWNTHIDVVETGYNQAFKKTTPALSWLASLANSIFTNIGWFGNIYFFIGLISVFMLILSKSGLAHKIGSTIRKGD